MFLSCCNAALLLLLLLIPTELEIIIVVVSVELQALKRWVWVRPFGEKIFECVFVMSLDVTLQLLSFSKQHHVHAPSGRSSAGGKVECARGGERGEENCERSEPGGRRRGGRRRRKREREEEGGGIDALNSVVQDREALHL